MLKGAALSHFYTVCKPNPRITQLIELCDNIRNAFEGTEYKRSMLTKWNTLTLRSIVEKHPDKSIESCLQTLIGELRATQINLDRNLQGDLFFQNKLQLACQDHPACSIACSIPANNSATLVNSLRSNIVTWETQNKRQPVAYFQEDPDEQFFTDRRYHSNRSPETQRYNQGRPYRGPPNNQYRQNSQQRQPYPNKQSQAHRTKKCFVCQKDNCWSTRHTQEERDKARAAFQDKFRSNFDRKYSQYLVEMEGEDPEYDPDDTPDLMEKFEALIVDDMTSNAAANSTDMEGFLTETGDLSNKEAKTLVTSMLNITTTHAMTKYQNVNDDIQLERKYHLKSSRYGPQEFIGIMVDTGAAGKSTAGYGQYQAYSKLFGSTPIDKSHHGAVTATFGIGTTSSVGSITINTPIGTCQFHIVEANTPFLLGINDMDEKRIMLDNLQNKLVFSSGKNLPIVRRFGHPFILWGPTYSTASYLTEGELRTLHRRFGHPSAQRRRHAGHRGDQPVRHRARLFH